MILRTARRNRSRLRRLPFPEMRHFLVGQILFFVLGGIVEAMAKLFAQKWREFAAPEFFRRHSQIQSDRRGTPT